MERHEELADRRYWIAYDHFMFEREARALRRRHLRATVGRALQRLLRRVRAAIVTTGTMPVARRARAV
ncbi:MAG: hypothetical protein U1F10_07655 [Burkholderiales bacterium]